MAMLFALALAKVPQPTAKTAMFAKPCPTANDLPSLLNHRRMRMKAAQSRMVPKCSCTSKRLPTIMEAECEDGGDDTTKSPVSLPTGDLRPACLPQMVTDALSLAVAASQASAVVDCLKVANRIERRQLLAWLFQSAPDATLVLALSEHGSRVVRMALEVAAGNQLHVLIAALEGSIVELAMSSFGHEVLMRLIEVIPSSENSFLVKELTGSAMILACHRYGCRVLNHLIMFLSEARISVLLDEILEKTVLLSKHEHGNGVLQRLLEYGTLDCQRKIVHCLLSEIHLLAMDKTASRVLQQVIDCCGRDEQMDLAYALLGLARASLIDIACSRCGSTVLRSLASSSICVNEFRAEFMEDLARLDKTKYGRRVLIAFRLSTMPDIMLSTYTRPAPVRPNHLVIMRSSRDISQHEAAAAA